MLTTPMSRDAELVLYRTEEVVVVVLRDQGDENEIAQIAEAQGDWPFDSRLEYFEWLVESAARFHQIRVVRVGL